MIKKQHNCFFIGFTGLQSPLADKVGRENFICAKKTECLAFVFQVYRPDHMYKNVQGVEKWKNTSDKVLQREKKTIEK
jgi:hypothetical protein